MQTAGRLAELLGSLSLATDLAAGLPRETAIRTSYLAVRLAAHVGIGGFELVDVFYTGLLRFLGCTAFSHEMAARYAAGDDLGLLRELTTSDADHPVTLLRGALRGVSRRAGSAERLAALARLAASPGVPGELARSHCELAVVLARRLGMSEGVIESLGQMYERWDGRGFPAGRAGTNIRRPARVVHVAWRLAAHAALEGPAEAHAMLLDRKGRELDPELAEAASGVAVAWLSELAEPSAWSAFLAAEPSPWLQVSSERLDDAAFVFGQFADVKSPWLAGHSLGVAQRAAEAAARLGFDADRVRELRVAALLHDVGRVAVPNGVWDKAGPLDAMERELMQSHALETRNILLRSPLLADSAELAASGHERLDASGYPRSRERPALSAAARLLAAADVYQALREDRPHRAAHSPTEAARLLREAADAGLLCEQSVHALLANGAMRSVPAALSGPSLSEREVEILGLVARGASNKQIAASLDISQATVKRHQDSIFGKVGVRTRAAVTVWAIERSYITPAR